MRNPPSAVNIQRLPQAYVPDNTRAFQTLANFAVQASAQHAKIKQNKADIETAGNLLGKYNVSAKTGAVLEEQTAQVEAARQKAIDEVYSMGDEQIGMAESAIKNANAIAEKNLANIKSNGIMASLLENPDDFKSLMTLQQSNPALAEGVVGIIRKGDERMTAELAKEAQEANVLFANYGTMLASYGKEVADSMLSQAVVSRKEQGKDVSKIEPMLTMGVDEAGAFSMQQRALSGEVLKLSPVASALDQAKTFKEMALAEKALANTAKIRQEMNEPDEPEKRDTFTQDGVSYYLDTKEKVLPNVESKADRAERVTQEKNTTAFKSYKAATSDLASLIKAVWNNSFSGFIPNISSGRRAMNQSKKVAFQAVKDVVRGAGEGVFTDADAKYVMELLPDEYLNDAEVDEAMARVDNYIAAKLGIEQQTLPDGVTEDDITTTMQANNMTREEVLARLQGG